MICFLDAHNADYEEIAKIDMNGKINYCKKHDYNFVSHIIEEKDYVDRTPHWGKISAIKANLSNCDWLFYCDSDTILWNNLIKLEKYIDDKFNMILGPLPYEGHISTSAFLLRNCQWSFDLLNQWFEQKLFIDHTYYPDPDCDYKATGKDGDGGMYFEQSAIAYLYDTNKTIRQKIKRIPQNDFNCTVSFHHSTVFLIHFPAHTMAKKIRSMNEWTENKKNWEINHQKRKAIKLC